MAFSPETYVLLNGKIKKLQGEVDKLESATKWLGVTTTPITDGSSVNPIVIDGVSKTAVSGDIVSYNNSEFIFNGNIWQEFGGDSGQVLNAHTIMAHNNNSSKSSSESTTTYNEKTYYEIGGGYISSIPFDAEGSYYITSDGDIGKFDGYLVPGESKPFGRMDYICFGEAGESKENIIDDPAILCEIAYIDDQYDPHFFMYLTTPNAAFGPWWLYMDSDLKSIDISDYPSDEETGLVSSNGVYKFVMDNLPKQGRITINSDAWVSSNGNYSQIIEIYGYDSDDGLYTVDVGETSKIDIQANIEQLGYLKSDNVSGLVVENHNGVFTMYALGAAPTRTMTIQCIITEIDSTYIDDGDKIIIGNPIMM